MPKLSISQLKQYFWSLRFWLVLTAATIFTIGAIRASAAATVVVTSPLANETISGNQVTVNLELVDFQTVDWQNYPQKRSGQGHIHLWLDQSTPTAASAVKTTSRMYIFDNVRAGNHTLLVELVNNDHTPLIPPATASVNFNTQAASAASDNSSVVLWLSITAFLLVTAALFMLSSKTKLGSGKQPKKSKAVKTKGR